MAATRSHPVAEVMVFSKQRARTILAVDRKSERQDGHSQVEPPRG